MSRDASSLPTTIESDAVAYGRTTGLSQPSGPSEIPWQSLLEDTCRTEYRQVLVRWKITGRWTRPYSEILSLRLEGTDATFEIVAKRSIECPANDAYRMFGSDLERETRGLRWACQSVAESAQLHAPRLLATRPEWGLMLMEFVEGEVLDRRLSAARYLSAQSRRRSVCAEMELLGQWLRCFQSSGSVCGRPLELDQEVRDTCADRMTWWMRKCERQLAEIEKRTSNIGLLIPNRFASQVMDRFERLLQQVEPSASLVACHGDFGPWNAVVNQQGLAVYDLFTFHPDLPLVDVLNVSTYLEALADSPSLSRDCVQQFRDAFVEGYGRSAIDSRTSEYQFCETIQRICRLCDCVASCDAGRLARWRNRNSLKRQISELIACSDRCK